MGTRTFRQALNVGSSQTFHDASLQMRFGNVLRKHLKVDLRMKTPAVDAAVLSTLAVFPMDPEAPASTILRGYARVAGQGGGTPVELAVQALYTTPQTGQVAIAPNGKIVILAADKYSSVDVEYMPADGAQVILKNCPVTSNAYALPTAVTSRGVVYLVDANATAAGVTGRKNIESPSGSAASATNKARLDLAKTSVKFAAADAVTLCDLTLYIGNVSDTEDNTDLDALLQSDSNLI